MTLFTQSAARNDQVVFAAPMERTWKAEATRSSKGERRMNIRKTVKKTFDFSGSRFLGLALTIAGFAFISSAKTYAADFDGSKPLMCATIEALDCVPGQSCTKGRASEMGAPPFMRIDFTNKTIGGVKRTTQILSMDKTEDQIGRASCRERV